MADLNDTSKVRSQLAEAIEAQRVQLLQAHGVLMCSYEVLLHAEGDHAIYCAQAARVAASLINKSVEDVDLVRIGPLIDALLSKHTDNVDRSRVLDPSSGRSLAYPCPRGSGRTRELRIRTD